MCESNQAGKYRLRQTIFGLGWAGLVATATLPATTSAVAFEQATSLSTPRAVCGNAFSGKVKRGNDVLAWPLTVIESQKGLEAWENFAVDTDLPKFEMLYGWRPRFVDEASARSVMCIRYEFKAGGGVVSGRPALRRVSEIRVVDLLTARITRQGTFTAYLQLSGATVPTAWVRFMNISGMQVAVPSPSYLSARTVEWLCNDKALPCEGRRCPGCP